MADVGGDEDPRESDEQWRTRRRRGAVFAVVGILLIVVSVAARRWAEHLNGIRGSFDNLPDTVMTVSWWTLGLGAACVAAAAVGTATTIGGRRG